MSFLINLKNNFLSGKWIEQTCIALVIFNALSLLAPYHWVFDLFANFKLQYFTGSVVLLIFCLLYRYKWFALCMAVLAVALFVEVQYSYSRPFASPPSRQGNLTVAQYNKLYFNHRYDKIGAWLRDPENDFDVIVINESRPDAIEPLKKFKDVYPYQSPWTQAERFGDISILSKWPITVTPERMEWNNRVFNASKILLKKDGLETVVIYAYHAQVPIGKHDFSRRTFELQTLAGIIQQEKEKNVVMMGDWNLTPYSPHFKDILRTTGLNYQNYGLFPQTTWPSFNYFEFLKIPIDHVLFDNNLELVSIQKDSSNGSDHQSLIAKFYVNKMNGNIFNE